MDNGQHELLRVVFTTPHLKFTIDEYLDTNSKIGAIKALKEYCETTSYPDWLKNGTRVSLRLLKDVVDRYAIRRTIYSKLTELSKQIELYCNKHGYNNMGSKKGAKSKDGLYTHQYSDYELIEDHLKFLVNNFSWKPSHNEYKEYNKLWRKYNEST
jgi:uncharacterized protein YdiU (UPF0061 family)